MRRLLTLVLIGLQLWLVMLPYPAKAAFDASEYRVNTYGTPDHYCDPTRALDNAGTGTLGDPWNYTQCMSEPVAGDVIGHLPVGAGTPVDLPTRKGTGDEAIPAFNPANSGTQANPIVHVTKYAAVNLGASMAAVAASQNRTEIRHDGTGSAADVIGTGGATFGASSVDYIVFDGFFVNMAQAHMVEDSGVFTLRATTGSKILNTAIMGETTDCDYNCVVYRPDNDTDSLINNLWTDGFHNVPTGAGLNQEGLIADFYGSHNYIVEHFLITDTDRGWFPKGTSAGGTRFNYGEIRYGVLHDVTTCFRYNDFDASELSALHHVLCYDYQNVGINLSSETSTPRNFLVHHVTFANGCTDTGNCVGPLYIKNDASLTNVTFRDNIFDLLNTGSGRIIDAGEFAGTFDATLNYNGYYHAGADVTFSLNSSAYANFTDWKAAGHGEDANSVQLATSPFTNRATEDFTIAGGHAALTASSTGGELGAYEGAYTIGLDLATAGETIKKFMPFNLRR